jgi:HK97 gp10 family phage protein
MGSSFTKTGDWQKAGMVLRAVSENLSPEMKKELRNSAEEINAKLISHIEAQDLDWTPLTEETIRIKHGNDTIYVDTGYLKGNLGVRMVKSSNNSMTIFAGASAWKRTPKGAKFSDLMMWLEYGTAKMPPRPLIRPTFEEMKPVLEKNWQSILQEFINAGGKINVK